MLGKQSEPAQAKVCFEMAALSSEAVGLRHLARCYRNGIGCPVDQSIVPYDDYLVSSPGAATVKDRQTDRQTESV